MAGLLPLLGGYLAIGAVVALPFAFLVGRLEPSAHGGSIGFRLLILPGAILLWPLIVARLFARPAPRAPAIARHVRAHRVALAILAVLLGLALGHALVRRSVHHDASAEAP
jgi:hypothetical protein